MSRSFGPLALAVLFVFPVLPSAAQSFEDALALAYERNPGLQAQRAALRAADEGVAEALSGYHPSVEASSGIGSSKQKLDSNGMFSGSDTLTPKDVGVTLVQPVFRGFRTQGSVNTAEAKVKAARATLKDAEQTLLFEAAQAYLDILKGQSIVSLTRNNEKVLQEQLDATTSRLNVGEVTKTDVSQSIARLNAAVAARTRAEGNLANHRASFTRLIGQPPEELRYPQTSFALPKSAEETAALAEKNNPALLAASFNREAAQANITTAQGALLPEINLVGTISRAWDQSLMIPNRQDNATLMARLTVPLYKSGADYARTRAARQVAVQRRLELEEARRQVKESALCAWQNLETARAALKAFQSEKKANELALYGVQEEAKVGTRTTLDVLNARQELLDAEVNLVKARHDEAIAMLQIKMSNGSLTAEDLGLPVKAYDPKAPYEEARGKWIGLGEEESSR